ncbi:MAG TPA: arabinofuranosidase catalytic domain-containing protein [Polyangia bacterium]|nr:arabinofuranosidase catalytic domain-containing protein [Polyangia bacterium]
MISGACSSGSSHADAGSSGGSTGTGGKSGGSSGGATGSGGGSSTGGTGGPGACTPTASVSACGGTVTGTWNVTSGCLSVSGDLDVRTIFSLSCATGQVTGSLQVTGTWTANADGTFTDNTTTTGTETLTLPSDCLILSQAQVTCDTIGSVMSGGYYETASCVAASSGGCVCTGTINQMGSMGLVTAAPDTSGSYTAASNTITNTQDQSAYSYCVSGGKLTVTPQGTQPAATGTIVLQSGATTGSGGSTGSGGAGTGGSTGSGGAGSGGSKGTGGSGTGGSPGTGGHSTGGSTGTGGQNTGGTVGSGGSSGTGGTTSTTRGQGPCDIYAAANMKCGAAYSTVRALLSTYTGPLYQVRNMSSATNTGTGGTTKDITQTPDGYADTSVQDSFCSGTTCSVSKLYDQSGNANDLIVGSPGPSGNGARSNDTDYEAVANKVSVTAGGHKVYPLYVQQYAGYRTPLKVKGTGIPMGNVAQGIYELVDGTHFGAACCWDFGAVSPDPTVYVTMNTVFFGKGYWGSGAGNAPWFMGDFEGGVWAGGTGAATTNNPMDPSMSGVNFALGILHTPVGQYAIRAADISKATDLTTAYDGAIPSGKTWGNAGGIVLGVGGDNSNNSEGTFYEGAITNGAPSNATDLLIMKNLQAVGYTK